MKIKQGRSSGQTMIKNKRKQNTGKEGGEEGVGTDVHSRVRQCLLRGQMRAEKVRTVRRKVSLAEGGSNLQTLMCRLSLGKGSFLHVGWL